MYNYLFRRLFSILPALFISSVLVFLIIHFIPGDPVLNMLPPNPPQEDIAKVRAQYGFDRPLYEQYAIWLGNVLRGNLGNSISNGFAVNGLLWLKLGVTLQLAAAGMLLALVIAIPMGIAAGLNPSGISGRFLNLFTTLGFAVPNFWLGILLILLFAVTLRWLPTSGFTNILQDPEKAIRALILPALTLSIGTAVVVANFLARSLEEVMRSEYITASIARGMPRERIVMKHALKNAMIPVVTVAMLQLGIMLGGAVVTESVFGIPGLGRLIVEAISSRDYPVIQASILLVVVIFLVLNFFTDLMYSWLDPRIRLG
jgi:peptide/nickel transport system permease protein